MGKKYKTALQQQVTMYEVMVLIAMMNQNIPTDAKKEC